jgi:hypothetical protein
MNAYWNFLVQRLSSSLLLLPQRVVAPQGLLRTRGHVNGRAVQAKRQGCARAMELKLSDGNAIYISIRTKL